MGMKHWLAGVAVAAFAAVGAYVYLDTGRAAAPESTFVLLDGSSQTTADLRGKVTLVNFWATSCTTCIKEMPALIETHHKYAPQGYETLAVAMDYDPPGFVSAYALKTNLPFKVAHDADGSVAKAFGDIRLTPTTFLVDKQGNIVKRYLGEPDFAALHAEIEALLKAPA